MVKDLMDKLKKLKIWVCFESSYYTSKLLEKAKDVLEIHCYSLTIPKTREAHGITFFRLDKPIDDNDIPQSERSHNGRMSFSWS